MTLINSATLSFAKKSLVPRLAGHVVLQLIEASAEIARYMKYESDLELIHVSARIQDLLILLEGLMSMHFHL